MADALMDAPQVIYKIARVKPGRRKSLAQILAMQEVLHSVVAGGTAKPLELASCARAWADLEERKRILRGKPLPGSLRPLPEVKSGKADAGLVR